MRPMMMLCLLALLATPARAGDNPLASWLPGHWIGQLGEDTIEEGWFGPSQDGAMVGMFRWEKEGGVFLYEMFELREDDNGLALYMRHFNRDLIAWEEPEVPMIFDHASASAADSVVFVERGAEEPAILVYEADGPDRLVVTLHQVHDGVRSPLAFHYSRKP